MDYNTFERAFILIDDNSLKTLQDFKKDIENLIIELNEEKKMLSNDIRFTTEYFKVNANGIDKKIKEVDYLLPKINEKVKTPNVKSNHTEIQSRMILRVRELIRERKRLLKKKSDYMSKVKRLNQNLIDLYLEIEDLRKKLVDVANAMKIVKSANAKGIFFSDMQRPNVKEVYDFFKKTGVI